MQLNADVRVTLRANNKKNATLIVNQNYSSTFRDTKIYIPINSDKGFRAQLYACERKEQTTYAAIDFPI